MQYVGTRDTSGRGAFVMWDEKHHRRDLSEVYREEGGVVVDVARAAWPPGSKKGWRPRGRRDV